MALLLTLALVVPLPLVAGSPLTLAERALSPRDDGTLGPREVVVGVGRSPAGTVLTRPVVAPVVLVAGLVVLHTARPLELVLTTHPGHLVMVGSALTVGVLWAAAMTAGTVRTPDTERTAGTVPPDRQPDARGGSPSRTVLGCLGALVLGAFAAAAWLARGPSVLAAEQLGGLELPWLRDLAADQMRAGAVVLFVVVPVCVLLAVVAVTRSQPRSQRRPDGRGR
jgi:putative copper resistance protein D